MQFVLDSFCYFKPFPMESNVKICDQKMITDFDVTWFWSKDDQNFDNIFELKFWSTFLNKNFAR